MSYYKHSLCNELFRNVCVNIKNKKQIAVSVDRTRDLQIFSLTLSQLSYPRNLLSLLNNNLIIS